MKSYKTQMGFTLVELLIVIAILAILAVAVLSAINPIEQISKGNDTGKKSDAAELLSAYERYYVTYQTYPWDASKTGATLDKKLASDTAGSGIDELLLKNELKSQFKTRSSLANLYVTSSTITSGGSVNVCFLPTSATFKALATKNQDGTTGCTGTTCYVCVPE